MHTIERTLKVTGCQRPRFGPQSDRLYFTTDVTESNQLWCVEAGESWPQPLSTLEASVQLHEWSPTREEAVLSVSPAGSRTQLVRVSEGATNPTPLTSATDATHRFGGWSHDGEFVAYAANRRTPESYDVYVQPRDGEPGAERRVRTFDGEYGVRGWRPDDETLLVSRSVSQYENELLVVDVETGETTQITPEETTARYQQPRWSADGESIYLVTDEESDTMFLGELSVETGELTRVRADDEWNIRGLDLHPESGRIAFVRNANGFMDLFVGRLEDGHVTDVVRADLPEGVVIGPTFDSEGDRLAVTVTTSTLPPSVFVVDPATGAANRRTDPFWYGIEREALRSPETVRCPSFDEVAVPAFYWGPPGDATDAPAVIRVHGGPESQRVPAFDSFTQYLLGAGYAVLEPNVRGSTGYGREYAALDDGRNRLDAIADLERCAAWLGDRPGVSADRIGLFGASYGGFATLSALTEYPETWAAGVSMSGITNLVTFLENTAEWRRPNREAEYGSLAEDREFLESISPLNNVEELRAPTLLLHGERDTRVPAEETRQFAERAEEHDVRVESVVYPDESHGITSAENRADAFRKIASFFAEHL